MVKNTLTGKAEFLTETRQKRAARGSPFSSGMRRIYSDDALDDCIEPD